MNLNFTDVTKEDYLLLWGGGGYDTMQHPPLITDKPTPVIDLRP